MIRFKETAAIFLFLATVHAHPGGYAFHSAATGLGSASASAGAYSGAVVSSEPYGPSGLGQFGARYSSNIGVRDNEPYPGAAAGDLGKAPSLRPNQSHRGKSQNGCSKCDDGQYKGDEYYEENEEEEDYEDEGDECDDGDDGQYHEHYNKGGRPGSHRHPAQAHSPDKAGAEVDKSGGPLGVQKVYGGGAGKFDAQQPSPRPSWQQPGGVGNLGNNVGQPGIPQSQASTPTWQQQDLPGSWSQSPGDNAHGPSNCGSLQCGEPHRPPAGGASSGPPYPGSPPSTYSSYGSGANGGKFIPSPGNPFLSQGVQKQSPIADGSTYGDGNAFGLAKPPGPHSDYKPSTQSTQPPIASFPGPAQQPNQYGGYYPQSQTTHKPFGSASGPSQRPNQYDGYNAPSQITQKPFGSTFGPAQHPNQFDGYDPQSQTAQKPFGSASDPAQRPNQYGGYNPQSQTTQKPFGSASGPAQHPNQFNGYNPQSQTTQKPFGSASGPAQHPNQFDGYNPQSQITQKPFGSTTGPAQHPNQYNGYNHPQSQITQKPFGSASGPAQHPNQYGGYNPPSQTIQTTQRPSERTSPSTRPGYYGGYSTVSQSTPSPFGGTTPIPTPKRPNFPTRPPWTNTQSTPSWNQNKPNTYNYSNSGSPNTGAPSGCSGAPGGGSGSNCNSLSKDLEPPKKTPYGQSEPNPYSPGKEGPEAQCSAGNKSACSGSKKGDDSPLFYIQVQPAIPGRPGSGRKPPIESGSRPTNNAGAENNRPYGPSTPAYGNSNTFPNAAFPLTGSTPSWSPSTQAPDNKPGDYGYTHGSPYDQRNTDKTKPWKVTGDTGKYDDSGPTGTTPSWPAGSAIRCNSNNCNNYGPGGHSGTTPSPWPAPKEHRAPCTSGNCQNSSPVGKNDYPPNAGSTPFWSQGRGSSPPCTSSNCQSYAPGGPPVTTPSPWSQSSAGPAHKPEDYSPGRVPGAYPSGNSYPSANRPQSSGSVSPGSYTGAGASTYGGSPSHPPLSSGPGAGTFPPGNFPSSHPLAGGNGAPETNYGPGSECNSASVPGGSPCSARGQPQGSAGSSGSCGGSASGGCGGGAAAGPTKILGSAGGVGAGDIGKNNPFFGNNPAAREKGDDDRALAVTPLGGPTERPIGKGNPFLDKSYVVPEGGYAGGGGGAYGGQSADNHGPKTSRPIGQGNPFLEGLQPNRGHPNYNGDQGPKSDDERNLQVTPLGGYGPTAPPTIPRQPWSSDSGFPKPAHPEADYSQGPAAPPAHSGPGTPCGPVKCAGNQLDDGSYGASSPENRHNGSNGGGSLASAGSGISKSYNPYSGFERGSNQASKQTGGANWTFGHTGSSASAGASASAYAYSGSNAGSWSGK